MFLLFFFLMIRPPPRSTRTYTLFPYTTLFRSLNLTAADTVIHYDPWWNPAAEAQASDRAHRIGQDKPVFVFRLITSGTVEERIEELKARKAELATAVLEGGGSREKLSFDQTDLDALLAPG